MAGKPGIEPLHGALAKRERGVRCVFDLRHRSATDARNDRELSAVELPMRELFREENQCRDCGGATERIFLRLFNLEGYSFPHDFVFKQTRYCCSSEKFDCMGSKCF